MSAAQIVFPPLFVRALVFCVLAATTQLMSGCASSPPMRAAAVSGNSAARNGERPANSIGMSSGIYGSMVSARGNPPAHFDPYECVKVFDATGRNRIATGVCSGMLGNFRVLLSPGNYIVEAGGSWESENGSVHFRPRQTRVKVGANEWVNLTPPASPGPVP